MIVDNEKLKEKINQLEKYLNNEYCRNCCFEFTITIEDFKCPLCYTKAQYLFKNNIQSYGLYVFKIVDTFKRMLRFQEFHNGLLTFNFVDELKKLETRLKITNEIYKIANPRLKQKIKRDESFIMTWFDNTVKLFGETNE